MGRVVAVLWLVVYGLAVDGPLAEYLPTPKV